MEEHVGSKADNSSLGNNWAYLYHGAARLDSRYGTGPSTISTNVPVLKEELLIYKPWNTLSSKDQKYYGLIGAKPMSSLREAFQSKKQRNLGIHPKW